MSVTILMPIKNAAPWIIETLSSIQKQSYTNWELICVNDFSTDESEYIVAKFANSDKRIQLIQNETPGIIPALQLGLALSSGEFITRMDADDIMPLERLDQMVNRISNESEKTVVTGKVNYFSEDLVSEGYIKYEKWLNDRIDNKDHFSHIFRECIIASPNWMVRKKDLLKFNVFNELQYPEDYDMAFHWFAKGFTIAGLDETTLLWREHPERTSRNSHIYKQKSFFQLKLNWFQKLNKHGNKRLAVFGAGPKGKMTTDYLISAKSSFTWYDMNAHKYGGGINGLPIRHPKECTEDAALICVYPDHLPGLEKFLKDKGFIIGENAWYL